MVLSAVASLFVALVFLGSPAKAAEAPSLARARALAAELSGPETPRVVVTAADDPRYDHTPAYAIYGFRDSQCRLYVNDEAVRRYDFEDEFSFRFMIYHELSHCYLYANPRPIRAFPGLSERANRLVSDLVELEFLQSDVPGRVNGYNAYQETFADVRAISLLVAEGQPLESVQRLLSYRRDAESSAVDPHNDAPAVAEALEVPWASLGAEEREARARAIADGQVKRAFLQAAFHPERVPFVASDMLAGDLRGPFSDLTFAFADPEDRAGVQRKLADAPYAPWPVWREYARLADRGLDAAAFVSAFFRARYGVDQGGLAQDDAALAAALSQ